MTTGSKRADGGANIVMKHTDIRTMPTPLPPVKDPRDPLPKRPMDAQSGMWIIVGIIALFAVGLYLFL